MSTQTNTTADALMGLADAFEKVAMAIEEQEANEKTVNTLCTRKQLKDKNLREH